MGFRSEIFIKIENSLVEEFNKLLKDVKLDDSIDLLDNDGEYTRYAGDWLKWYNGYKDVDAINRFIDEHYETCGLLGIGEDYSESAKAGSPEELDMFIISDIDW